MESTSPSSSRDAPSLDTSQDSESSMSKRRPDTMLGSPSKPPASAGYKVVDIPPLPEHLDMPPLPTIKNKMLEKKVFTHISVTGSVKKGVKFVEDEDELKDNEKMEWVGDGLLKAICTRLLERLWPRLAEGPSTTILSHLVSNTTLAYVTRRYNLMKKYRVAPSARMSIETSEKNQANLLEAYIAGLFQSILEPNAEGGPHPNGSATATSHNSSTPHVKNEALGFALPASNGAPAKKTEGQAYDEISEWLVPLFTPIAFFIRDHLHAERQRITQVRSSNVAGDDDDSHIDPVSVTGSTARLNEYFIGRLGLKLPLYESTPTEGLLWRTRCIVTLRDGQQLSAETVQTGKKPGMQVTAYKILLKLGLVKAEDLDV